jgi:hypothetical protein
MNVTLFRKVFLWVAYFAWCFSLVWYLETFSKVKAASYDSATCFFYVSDACERMISSSATVYWPFQPALTWVMILGLIGLALTAFAGGQRNA